jgi:2-polyprenyl-6-methoxyphenol hydroxylase-like FAD-dependent oxidoreductase
MAGRRIAIAGCGIAGLACAALLAREGERVTVFDRLEIPQPLGSGLILQPVGLAVLDEIGAGARLRRLGAPLQRLFGRVRPSNRVVLDVRYRDLGGPEKRGLSVHRGALFEALFDAAIEAGAEIAPGRESVSAGDGRLAFKDGTQSAKFDLVVDALGVKSPLSRTSPPAPLHFGALWGNVDWPEPNKGGEPFDERALEQRYEAARMMVGVLPIGSLRDGAARQAAFFWSLKHVDHAAWRAGSLDAWKEQVLRLWPETAPMLGQIRSHEQMIFASYAHGTLASPLTDGVVHVGDSWHSASPQLGQGANMALLDSFALARALACRADVPEALAAYVRARSWHIRLYQLASWMFTPAYQSDSLAIAWLRDWLVAPLSRIWPAPTILAALVAGSIGSPLKAIARIQGRTQRTLPTAAGAN